MSTALVPTYGRICHYCTKTIPVNEAHKYTTSLGYVLYFHAGTCFHQKGIVSFQKGGVK